MARHFQSQNLSRENCGHGPSVSVLITHFNRLFGESLNTHLESGGAEPLYQPATGETSFHRIIFTRDYLSSALHEVAHWCIAGPERRLLQDYGYWYEPDGRNSAQQSLFERVEVKPQAIEWIFSRAAGIPFRVSADNLSAGTGPSDTFKNKVWQQVGFYCESGLPERAQLFAAALAREFGGADYLAANTYKLEDL